MHIILNSYGASIRRSNGLFEIATADGKQLLPARDIKSIQLSKGARVSSDAILLAIEHEIDIMFVDGLGQPKGRVWSVRYGSISDIRRQQLNFLYSQQAIEWVKQGIQDKINKQMAMLMALEQELDEEAMQVYKKAIRQMNDYKAKVSKLEGELISDIAPALRGWEGAASRAYFQCVSLSLPVQYQFDKRSQHPATDAFNAMLNYGYGMLYGKIEGALIKAGIDPYVGIFHRDDYNRPALVYDVIEQYRIWVDYVVIQLCRQSAMSEECFKTEGDAVMLHGLGKRILIQSVNDYMEEVIKIKGIERSRATHIQWYAHELAKLFLESKQEG